MTQHLSNPSEVLQFLAASPQRRLLTMASPDQWEIREATHGFSVTDPDGQLVNIARLPLLAVVDTSAAEDAATELSPSLWCSTFVL